MVSETDGYDFPDLGHLTEAEFLELRVAPRFYDGPLFTKERLDALRRGESMLYYFPSSDFRMQTNS
jgi:hypothetical protein